MTSVARCIRGCLLILVISQAACHAKQRTGGAVATYCGSVSAPIGHVELSVGMRLDSLCLVVDRSLMAADTAAGLKEVIAEAGRNAVTRIDIGERLTPLSTTETKVDTTAYWEVVITYPGEHAVAACVSKVTGDVEHLGINDRILNPATTAP